MNNPQFKKTGTTIVGLKYRTGIILCADTRSTSGPIVANKNCLKIHTITPKIFCCGAGTAADTDRVTRMGSKELIMYERKYLKEPRVSHFVRSVSNHLHPYKGHIGAALIVGGMDVEGFHLYGIHPHGSVSEVSYTSLGSGSLGAISVLESEWKEMDKEDAIELGCKAIKAGILNDLYSGSNIDVVVIDQEGIQFLRSHKVIGKRSETERLEYPQGSVKILKEEVFRYVEETTPRTL